MAARDIDSFYNNFSSYDGCSPPGVRLPKIVIENKEKIIKMFDQRFFRMWEFYLLASKYSFVNMGNVVFQIQIAKNINNLPLTRNYIYN